MTPDLNSSLSSLLTRHLPSYAKINLGLEVLRKRSDGYHDINTIFARISLHDTLTFTPRTDDRLLIECTPSLDIPIEENLVWKVANHLYKYCTQHSLGTLSGVSIDINKHIPTGGGLGGGSSNAALTLRVLSEQWNIQDPELLSSLAIQYGSDIPFFLLDTRFAVGTSRGETLEPLSVGDVWDDFVLLLCFPGIHVSTPLAYKAINRKSERSASNLADLLSSPDALLHNMVNDFELPVFEQYPLLRMLHKTLQDCNTLRAWMSGSGSTMIGIFHQETEALSAARHIEKLYAINTQIAHFV